MGARHTGAVGSDRFPQPGSLVSPGAGGVVAIAAGGLKSQHPSDNEKHH